MKIAPLTLLSLVAPCGITENNCKTALSSRSLYFIEDALNTTNPFRSLDSLQVEFFLQNIKELIAPITNQLFGIDKPIAIGGDESNKFSSFLLAGIEQSILVYMIFCNKFLLFIDVLFFSNKMIKTPRA